MAKKSSNDDKPHEVKGAIPAGNRNQPAMLASGGHSGSAVVPPRAGNSGFKRTLSGKASVREKGESHFLPGQGLADPNLHPEHPGVIVNQPYGSPAASLDTATGKVTPNDVKPEDIATADRAA